MPRGSADLLFIQKLYGDAVTVVLYDNPDQIRLDLLAKRIDMTFGAKFNWTLELINKPEGKDWKLAGGEHWVGDPTVPENERGLSWIVRKDAAGEALVKRMDVALEFDDEGLFLHQNPAEISADSRVEGGRALRRQDFVAGRTCRC